MKNDDKVAGVCKEKALDIPFVAWKGSGGTEIVNKRNRY
jgi:hypothetical protein